MATQAFKKLHSKKLQLPNRTHFRLHISCFVFCLFFWGFLLLKRTILHSYITGNNIQIPWSWRYKKMMAWPARYCSMIMMSRQGKVVIAQYKFNLLYYTQIHVTSTNHHGLRSVAVKNTHTADVTGTILHSDVLNKVVNTTWLRGDVSSTFLSQHDTIKTYNITKS